MIQTIKQLIEEAEIITVFRHYNADGDALGSQWGLITWLKEMYPTKQVYGLGKNNAADAGYFPNSDVISDEVIQQSLAITTDTATKDRIDDKRAYQAKKMIKIDHHINVDQYADYEYVDEQAASSCEIVAYLIQKWTDQPVSKEVANYLYFGILTDTLSFSVASVSSKTLQMAAYLAESGIEIEKINLAIKLQTFDLYRFDSYVREHAVFEDTGVAYMIITHELVQSFQITTLQAKERVNVLSNIAEYPIWLFFVEDDLLPGMFNASIRSRGVAINDIAAKYQGGGHKNASGAKGFTLETTELLLKDLRERVK